MRNWLQNLKRLTSIKVEPWKCYTATDQSFCLRQLANESSNIHKLAAICESFPRYRHSRDMTFLIDQGLFCFNMGQIKARR